MKNDVRLNLVVHRKLLQWFSIDLEKKKKRKRTSPIYDRVMEKNIFPHKPNLDGSVEFHIMMHKQCKYDKDGNCHKDEEHRKNPCNQTS